MSDDLAERLRSEAARADAETDEVDTDLLRDAADEIDRLRAAARSVS